MPSLFIKEKNMECKIFKETGVNAVNVPDSPARVLTWGESVKTSVIDCLQERFLKEISVSATWLEIRNADYCVIDGFYYFITGITMTSYDVARLTLEPDFLTSAGGPGSLQYLDGITERHHVPAEADTFGAYDEPDPLLSPSQPLELETMDGPFLQEYSSYVYVVESTIDLPEMANLKSTNALESVTYKEATGEAVTVPATVPTEENTFFLMRGTVNATSTNGSACYNARRQAVQQGLQIARDLGATDAVIAQWQIPSGMVFLAEEDDGRFASLQDTEAPTVADNAVFHWEYADVRNKRLLYGENNKYGLLSVAGNSSEFDPEDIYNSEELQPAVLFHADLRENGKPYFNFDTYRGQALTGLLFYKNAVAGMEWRNLPLRWTTKEGSIQDAYAFNSRREEARTAGKQRQLSIARNLISDGTTLAGSAMDVAESIAAGGGIGAVTGLIKPLANLAGGIMEAGLQRDAYRVQTERELYEFGISQNVIVPEIKFPFQSPAIRDYQGNGVLIYRYHPSSVDLARMDNILTAYGYRHTAPLEASFFTNRTHFNFVKASSISIGGNLPTWWKEGIARQLQAGVRVWHVKPDVSYYGGDN